MCNAAAPVLAVRSLNFRDVIVNDAADTRTATSGSAICGGSMTRRTSVQAYTHAADVAWHLALFCWHGMPKETWPKRCYVGGQFSANKPNLLLHIQARWQQNISLITIVFCFVMKLHSL